MPIRALPLPQGGSFNASWPESSAVFTLMSSPVKTYSDLKNSRTQGRVFLARLLDTSDTGHSLTKLSPHSIVKVSDQAMFRLAQSGSSPHF